MKLATEHKIINTSMFRAILPFQRIGFKRGTRYGGFKGVALIKSYGCDFLVTACNKRMKTADGKLYIPVSIDLFFSQKTVYLRAHVSSDVYYDLPFGKPIPEKLRGKRIKKLSFHCCGTEHRVPSFNSEEGKLLSVGKVYYLDGEYEQVRDFLLETKINRKEIIKQMKPMVSPSFEMIGLEEPNG